MDKHAKLHMHRGYMDHMFHTIRLHDVHRHKGFISALYATEAFLVEKALRKSSIKKQDREALTDKDESPAKTGLSPMRIQVKPEYIITISPRRAAVKATI